MCELGGAGAAGLGDRDHHVDVARWHGGHHTFGQGFAQVQAGLVHRDVVQHRIRAGQVHKLKDAGVELCSSRTLLRMHLALQVDKNSLAGCHVAFKLMPRALQRHRFAGHHHGAVLAATQAQRADAERVTECQHPMARDHGDHGIRALDARMYGAHRGKHVVDQQRHTAGGFFDLMRQHVEQHFGVAVGVGVAVVGGEQLGA